MKTRLTLMLALLLSLPLRAQKQVVIQFVSEEPAAILAAVDAFEQADILFTVERTVRPDDSPAMKNALSRVQWKNNELVGRMTPLDGVEVVPATPADMAQVISRAREEGWRVNVPSEWARIVRDCMRSYGGRNFYVSAEGNDDNDGLTPGTAWRSLEKVNEVLLGYADTVRFRSGDIFRGSLVPQSGRNGEPIVYTRFGKGEKPVLEPSWDASDPSDWVKAGRRLWKCEKPSQDELGNVILDHGAKGCAWKVDNRELLKGKDLHFCWVRDEKAVYMVSRRNPAKRFSSIELAEKHHVIAENNNHDVVYDGLWLRYGAAHGIGGADVCRIVARNLDISWIGGSTLYFDEGGRGVRYGNGIEFWGNASDILVENCLVWECWDAALTNQSNVPGSVQENITWRNNEIWNSEYSYEYWQQGEGCRTRNVVFEDNVCRKAGYGWGHRQRWNPNAAHLMFYDTTADTQDFVIRGNSFELTKNCGMRLFNAWYRAIIWEDNIWKIPFHYLLRYHGRPTSGLIFKYPDHLDKFHIDSEEEIQSQTVEQPLKLHGTRRGLRRFNGLFANSGALDGISHPVRPSDKERAAGLVSQMTLDEKINLISGTGDGFDTYAIPRLGIPSVRMADGPQGANNVSIKNVRSTFYPCGIAAAATWNRAAVYEMGAGIGCAARRQGVQIMLAPGANIYRSALCGRNFEYYGEDPYLAGETAVKYIQGMQDQGVIATIKHFALNQQEYDRHGVSSNADERTINEIYFPAFRKAVEKAGVGAVMTSYNPVNGVYSAENPWLIKENLRAWGHEGIVMTDWGSTYSTLGFMNGGADLEMPRKFVTKADDIMGLLDIGVVSESCLDKKCQHILQVFSAFGFLDARPGADPSAEDPAMSRRRAYEIALECPVLLKNEGDLLPLKPGKESMIVVTGPNAHIMACGGGSGWVNPEDGKGVTPAAGLLGLGKEWNVVADDSPKPELLRNASAVVVFVGFDRLSEGENFDRGYQLPDGQDALINRISARNPNVIVVANSGGEFDLSSWSAGVKAILLTWYPGQEGGNAIAAILTGKVSPSGKLPFTFWGSPDNNPAQKWYDIVPRKAAARYGYSRDAYPYILYGEGIFLGYRGVEHFGVNPLYPFGYGLSYTSFEYSDISVKNAGDGFDVSFKVRNTGKVAAKETVQLYVAPVEPSVLRPEKELKGYDKKQIAPGAAELFTIHLGPDAFSYYDVSTHDWRVDQGEYRILVGSSSADIRLEGTVKL